MSVERFALEYAIPKIMKMTAKVDNSFGWINYIVLIVYFGCFLGFFFMKDNKDIDDFFKAGGRIPWWAVDCISHNSECYHFHIYTCKERIN